MAQCLIWHSGPNCLLESHSRCDFDSIQFKSALAFHSILISCPFLIQAHPTVLSSYSGNFMLWLICQSQHYKYFWLLNSKFTFFFHREREFRTLHIFHSVSACAALTCLYIAYPWNILPHALSLQTWYPFSSEILFLPLPFSYTSPPFTLII